MDCRVMNIITSTKSFKNHARYLKNLTKSCKIQILYILSILALLPLAFHISSEITLRTGKILTLFSSLD